MGSTKDRLNFILDQLSDLEEISYKSMMGEFIIYYKGKIVAEICDDRLLVKPVSSAVMAMPDAPLVSPYDGAKKMLMVENTEKRFLTDLFISIYPELPDRRKKTD